ncbi:MAG: hypothetical protein CMN56_02200 [Sneathiella sp.]|nr:hypothetical protein [Sneathiella sp.]|tara:strand:+ start:571 stop:777 length:207 start_codon:yes stop_codon:yes gene_type:complete
MGEVRHSQAEKVGFLLIFPPVRFPALVFLLFGRFQAVLAPECETCLPTTVCLPSYIMKKAAPGIGRRF